MDKPMYKCAVCGSHNQGRVDEDGRIRCKSCGRQIRKDQIEAAEAEANQPAIRAKAKDDKEPAVPKDDQSNR